jgi:hypothetical protein
MRVGFSPDRLAPEGARWLLEFVVRRLHHESGPAVAIRSESGLRATIGTGEPSRHVSGSDARLWAWLAGRVGPEWVRGANGLRFGLLS